MVAPTTYLEVNQVLEQLLPAVRQILGEELAGAYLFGSLTSGDFDHASDVDILFAMRAELTSRQFDELKTMHERIAAIDSWCAAQLEVSYIPLGPLRRYDATQNVHPRLDRGPGESLYMMKHDSDWVVQRYLIREKGVALLGPPPAALIDPVSSEDLKVAMRPILEDWLAHLHESPEQIRFLGYQSYIVLTTCRVLYTLELGEVVSKRAAADWAKANLDPRWSGLIERACAGRQNPGLPSEAAELHQTFLLINYAQERHPSSLKKP